MTIAYTGDKPHHTDYRPWRALAAAVLWRATYEGRRGRVDALLWLASPDCELFCDGAGIHPDRVRGWALARLTADDPKHRPQFSTVFVQEALA